jgi:poly(3-hydroxybutyrate) depolymerase
VKISVVLLIGALLSLTGAAAAASHGAGRPVTIETRKSVIVTETRPLGTTVTAIAVKLSRPEELTDRASAVRAFELLEAGEPRALADAYTNTTAARSSAPRRGTWLILTVYQQPVPVGTTAITSTFALRQKLDVAFPDTTLRAIGPAFGLLNTVNPLVDKYTFERFTEASYTPLRYRLFEPAAAKTLPWLSHEYPLVLTLHGYGEAGADNRIQLEANQLSTAFAEPSWQSAHPAFVVSPQLVSGDGAAWTGKHVQDSLLALIARLEVEYPIDPSRIYVVGLSIGSLGAWQLVERSQKTFAAAIFDSYGGYAYSIAPMAHFPLWNIQSLDDDTVSYFTSIDAAAALTKAGARIIHHQYPGNLPLKKAEAAARAQWDAARRAHTNTLFTSFAAGTTGMPGQPVVGSHGSWIDIFRNPVYLEWMFAQSKPPVVPTPGLGGG